MKLRYYSRVTIANNIASFIFAKLGCSLILARLGTLSIFQTPQIRKEIEVALASLQQKGFQSNDTLCCGNFGRIEVLLVAANCLNKNYLLETARQWTAIAINQAREAGSFCLFANLPRGVYNPGFFQGVTGIGYELLRLAHPQLLPSILQLE